jgi:hypothetical protein
MKPGIPSKSWPGSRAAKASSTPSAWIRRAAKASACAEAWSSHWQSSTTQASGRCAAASDSRLRTARPIRKRSGGRPLDQAEGGPERIRLRQGQVCEMVEHRHAQLLEARKGQLHL